MKKLIKYLSALLVICMIVTSFAACGLFGQPGNDPNDPDSELETLRNTDITGSVKLDKTSNTKKETVTVRSFIDGDTTHFNISKSAVAIGVLKARYLAVNTPESTGKIEPYGKKAASFTKEKLKNAKEIIVESDDGNWNLDSTGGRHLVWVWYMPENGSEYRNLNIEILENGLAIASSSMNNRYGSICVDAINKAKKLKLNVQSNEKDPDTYYGEAIELTLKELRCNIEEYNGKKVAFEGVVAVDHDNTVYVESYDEETGMYYGMQVYYGFSVNGYVSRIIQVGNKVRIVATVSYYETGGIYQVSGLEYNAMDPKNPSNVQKISEGHEAGYLKTNAETFINGKVNIEDEEGESKEFGYAELALHSTISMDNLKVKSIYTTSNDASASKGAMTLTCEVDGVTVDVRTVVLYDDQGKIITEDAYMGKTINVKGLVDYYDGSYQIKVLNKDNIIINN